MPDDVDAFWACRNSNKEWVPKSHRERAILKEFLELGKDRPLRCDWPGCQKRGWTPEERLKDRDNKTAELFITQFLAYPDLSKVHSLKDLLGTPLITFDMRQYCGSHAKLAKKDEGKYLRWILPFIMAHLSPRRRRL